MQSFFSVGEKDTSGYSAFYFPSFSLSDLWEMAVFEQVLKMGMSVGDWQRQLLYLLYFFLDNRKKIFTTQKPENLIIWGKIFEDTIEWS